METIRLDRLLCGDEGAISSLETYLSKRGWAFVQLTPSLDEEVLIYRFKRFIFLNRLKNVSNLPKCSFHCQWKTRIRFFSHQDTVLYIQIPNKPFVFLRVLYAKIYNFHYKLL